MKTIVSMLLALCGAGFLVSPAATAAEPPDKTVKARFRVFGWDDSPTDLNYEFRGKDAALAIIQDNRSVFYDYTGTAVITFYRLKIGSDGKPVREIAARADLSQAGPWPLILLAKNQAKPERYDARVLRDDLVSFPAGSYAFSNFTGASINGSLGGRLFALQPGQHELIKATPRGNGTTVFAALIKTEERQKVPIYTNNWAIRPAMRTRVFIRASSDSPTGLIARRVVESTFFPLEDKEATVSAE
jgi:hypothetical protein